MDGLSDEFFKFLNLLGEKSENWKLINSFVWEEVNAIYQLLHSFQSGDHESRNTAIKRLIPLFFSMDSTYYKRWCLKKKCLDYTISN